MFSSLSKPSIELCGATNNSSQTLSPVIRQCISALIGFGASCLALHLLLKYMKHIDPTQQEKDRAEKRTQELMKKLGIKVKLTDYEALMASNLVTPNDISVSWESIGGLSDVISEIKETIILLFKKGHLFGASSLLSAPKGVLLFGPPGCGKTMIAKATAKASGVNFINLQISSLLDKWYGEPQKRVSAVFTLAMKLQPVIIFIDEIDALFRSRSGEDHEATVLIKTQFMTFWDGLMTEEGCQILIMGATNRPDDVDAAILRRMPSKYYIGLPKRRQRADIYRIILRGEQVDGDVNLEELARLSENFSGSDIKESCRLAAMVRVREILQQQDVDGDDSLNTIENVRAINMADFRCALAKMSQASSQSKFADVLSATLQSEETFSSVLSSRGNPLSLFSKSVTTRSDFSSETKSDASALTEDTYSVPIEPDTWLLVTSRALGSSGAKLRGSGVSGRMWCCSLRSVFVLQSDLSLPGNTLLARDGCTFNDVTELSEHLLVVASTSELFVIRSSKMSLSKVFCVERGSFDSVALHDTNHLFVVARRPSPTTITNSTTELRRYDVTLCADASDDVTSCSRALTCEMPLKTLTYAQNQLTLASLGSMLYCAGAQDGSVHVLCVSNDTCTAITSVRLGEGLLGAGSLPTLHGSHDATSVMVTEAEENRVMTSQRKRQVSGECEFESVKLRPRVLKPASALVVGRCLFVTSKCDENVYQFRLS